MTPEEFIPDPVGTITFTSFHQTPKAIGGWRCGLVTFVAHKEPSAWVKFWTKALLGWDWVRTHDET